jgi:hypothetical protein
LNSSSDITALWRATVAGRGNGSVRLSTLYVEAGGARSSVSPGVVVMAPHRPQQISTAKRLWGK